MRLIVFLFACFCVVSVAQAQVSIDRVQPGIVERGERLADLAADLGGNAAELLQARNEARKLRFEAEQATGPLRNEISRVKSDLERLGDAPKEGDPAEPAQVSAERDRLNKQLALYDGAIRQSDLNILEANRIIEESLRLQREKFVDELLSRGSLPFLPSVWADAGRTFADGAGRAGAALEGWRSDRVNDGSWGVTLIGLGGALLVALALFIPIRRRIDQMITGRIQNLEPLASRRVLVAAGRTAARTLPALLAGFILYQALSISGAITTDIEPLVRAVWITFVALVVADSAVMGVFAPRSPAWRVVPVKTEDVRIIRILFVTAVFVLGAGEVLTTGAEIFGTSVGLVTAIRSLTSVLLALMLFTLCRQRLWSLDEGDAGEEQPWGGVTWQRLRWIGQAAAIISLGAIVTGYVALGHYITSRMIWLIGLGAIIWLLRALLREGVRVFDDRFTASKKEDGSEDNFVFFWIGAVIDLVAILAFVPPALLALGADWADVQGIVVSAFLGFDVGSIRISLAKILAALGFFLGLLYLTRQVQKTAETQFFPKSRIDVGVQNSLKTLIGYVGLVIAFAVGVGTMGFDLSNLAIIAGALSVGIGFGLQSIVNNFVSGLILLFERPIKVGDWIVTTSGEGLVKRISVRSTEIETFDRSSVIVPNSELISSAVTNWTHKDNIGRMIVPVGVSYNADPEEVIKLLNEVADENESVLAHPKPFIYFHGFGDSSLDFELRGFISEVRQSIFVRSQLRIAIFKKLKAAGIEIPFPQRDIHIIAKPTAQEQGPFEMRETPQVENTNDRLTAKDGD